VKLDKLLTSPQGGSAGGLATPFHIGRR
jgi:hypothetical protein